MEDKTKANAALDRVPPAVRTVGVGAGALSAESSAFSGEPAPRTVSAGTNGAGFGRFVKRLAITIIVLLVLGIGGIVAVSMFTGDDKGGAQNVAGEFQETEIPLADLPTDESFSLGASSLTINGPLRVNDTFVLAPQSQPVQAVAGQLYFDQANSALTYYNGTDFVALQGNNVVSVTAGGPNVTVTDDGNGNVVISTVTSGGGGTISSAGGTAGRIAKFTGVQSLGDSILSESGTTLTVDGSLAVTGGVSLGTPLSVSNGGTGATTLAVNGVVVSNGTAALTSVTAGGAGLCLVSTAGAPAFAACPGGVGSAFVQDGNSFGQTAVLGTNDGFGLNFEVNTTTVMTISTVGAVNLRNQTNSVNAFRIQNSDASATVLNVDTTNQRVGVGGTAGLSKFEVLGGDAAIYNDGNNPRIIIGDSTAAGQNGFMMWDSTNNYLRLETTGTNGLKVNDNFVTIGNIFPDQPLKVANGTTLLGQIGTTGNTFFRTSTDSTSAFSVQSSLSNNALVVDTLNNRVGVGVATPTLTNTGLEVRGAVRLSGQSGIYDDYETPLGSNLSARISVQNVTVPAFSQIIAVGVNSTSDASARGIAVFDARAGGHQPSIALISPNEQQIAGFSWEGTNGDLHIKNSASGTIALNIAGTTRFQATTLGADVTGRLGLSVLEAGDNATYLCRNGSNFIATCSGTATGSAFVQGGNSFTGAATLGTNDAFDLIIERGGVTKLTVTANELSVASGIDLLLTGASAYISNPQDSPSGEAFGWDSAVGGNGVAVGRQASAGTGGAFGSPVAVGYQATAVSWGTALGGQSSTTGNEAVAVGQSATSAIQGVAVGSNATANSGGIAIGYGANTGGNNRIVIGRDTTATADNQLVIGSNTTAINHAILGNGVTNAAPSNLTLQATSGSGSNVAGANFTVAGGQSTGNASGGSVSVQVSAPGGSGSSTNSLSTVATFSGTNGALTLQNAANSENALRLLNAAGEQLLNVGTVPNADNLVTNGSIETNTTGWLTKGGSSIARITSQQYIGLASLQVDTSAAAGDGARYNVTLASSTEYTLQFWAKLSSGTFTNMAFGYSSDGVAETDCKASQQIKTGGWSVFNCTFTTGTVSGSPYFYWEQATGVARTVYIDALQIVPGPDIGVFYEGKIDVSGLSFNGPVAIQNDNDSQAALQIQNAGGTTVFGVDSLNLRVGINLIQAQAALHVTTIGTNSVTALFNQSGSSTEDILQLSKSNDITVSVAHTGATTFQNLTNSTTAFRVLASNASFGSGVPQFVIDTTNSRVYIGNPSSDTTGALLVLDTKSDAGDPTGVAGGMYYNSNAAKFRCYENGAWKNCLGMNVNLTFNGTNGDGSASLWSNMPAALTELWGRTQSRMQYDLTDANQVRLQVNVDTASSAGAALRAQYSTDQSSWDYLDGGTGPTVTVDSTGLKVSSWVNVTAGAKGDVYLRVVGIGADGVADPRFGHIQLQVR